MKPMNGVWTAHVDFCLMYIFYFVYVMLVTDWAISWRCMHANDNNNDDDDVERVIRSGERCSWLAVMLKI